MKIQPIRSVFQQTTQDLLKGDTVKVTPKQVDDVEDVNFKGITENHRVSYTYDKDLGRNVANIIDNSTGETVKKALSDAQVEHIIRTKRLMGLYVDEDG